MENKNQEKIQDTKEKQESKEEKIIESTSKEITERAKESEEKIAKKPEKEDKIIKEETKKIEEKVEDTEKKIAKDISKESEKSKTPNQEKESDPKEPSTEKPNQSDEEISKRNPESKPEQQKKKQPIKIPTKTESSVNGKDLRISTKQAIAICNFIRKKDIETAINELQKAEKMKIPIPMKGEIPHRKGKIMSGRYPIKAIKEFSRLLKNLKSNAVYHNVELEKTRISCKANVASRPQKRFGRSRFKRSHVEIKLMPFQPKTQNKIKGIKK